MTSPRTRLLIIAAIILGSPPVSAQTPERVHFSEAVAMKNPALKLEAETTRWQTAGGRVFAQPGSGESLAVAAYTVPKGAAGFYAIEDSTMKRETAPAGRVDLRVWVRRAGVAAEPAVATTLDGGEAFDFDTFLGYLDVGDTLFVGIGAAGDPTGDRTALDYTVVRTPAIAVTAFPEDFGGSSAVAAPGGWSLAADLSANSAAERQLAFGRNARHGFTMDKGSARLSFPITDRGAAAKEAAASFRVPHSGYYALHEAWQNVSGGSAEMRLYVGHESAPRRTVKTTQGSGLASLNTDIGYVEKGALITLAFAPTGASAAGGASPAVEFAGSLIEWAPRRAPIRVRRGADGLLDVYEAEAQRVAVDIPAARWITVPAQEGDATEAIRAALAKAQAAQSGKDYVGVRLEAGRTYVVASTPGGGPGGLFSVRNGQRLVFDGNGATLLVSSPELARREVGVFSALNSRDVVFADFTIKATTIPFTTGEVLSITPPTGATQTVTFRVTPGALDPVRDIARNGQADAYAYDPAIPGRLALGTWTHFPGRGNPPLQATDQPGVFTHNVTRTGNSISVGDKWLVKNKRGGVIYFSTRGSAENITLSGVTGLASGGGHLRFSQTSGINILDCTFEPDGENWISSSADSVHGRGREGVWIENTLIRGICEDVMNTYGQTMVVVADDDPADAVISLRMFEGGPESGNGSGPVLRMPSAESAAVGDQLLFFNPQTGQVLGHANITAIAANGRVTLSQSISGIDTWETGDGKGATMVYNTRVAGRFFVRDSRIMDSMRFGIYIKARAGVIFHTQLEGLSAPGVFATNEPEWPEGPPATHLWVQGCTFSQNNYGYMPRNRAFMVVDPADISIYTRRLRGAAEPEGFRAHLTTGQYANSHMKLVGNVFHDWRGLGISVRNARNVLIRDNLFLPPVRDDVMRRTLGKDPALASEGSGRFAGIFLGSVDGARVAGNRAFGLPVGDRLIAREADALGLTESDNTSVPLAGTGPEIALSFGEWFGPTSTEAAGMGVARDRVELRGATHRAGRLGAGLFFDGKFPPARMIASTDSNGSAVAQLSVALWIQSLGSDDTAQVIHAQGDRKTGLLIAVDRGRLIAGLWQANDGAWLDLGSTAKGQWQHVALVYDGTAGTLRGFVDGLELATAKAGVPAKLDSLTGGATFGGLESEARLADDRMLASGTASYHGGLDEFVRYRRALSATEISLLALRRPLTVAASN